MQRALKKWFPIFLAPTVIAYIIVFVLPFIAGIVLSFTEFRTVTNAQFVGVENYVMAFMDDGFKNAFFFTAKFTIVSLITINVLGFTFALILTKSLKGENGFRTVLFMPNLIGGIVLGYIWQMILNSILYYSELTIYADAKYGFWGLVLLMTWQLTGYMMIIYVAAIQNIPGELIEAARVDGASKFKILTNVTIPTVMPAFTICLFLTLTNSFKLFDQNLALTNGAPSRQTTMLALDIYETFYGRVGWAGVGQAKAVVFFLLVAVIAFLQLKLTRSKEEES